MTVIEEERNQPNVEQEVVEFTETDDLEAMAYGSQPVLTEKLLQWKPQAVKRHVIHDALTQRFEVLHDVLIGEYSRIEEFEGIKEERDHWLKQMSL